MKRNRCLRLSRLAPPANRQRDSMVLHRIRGPPAAAVRLIGAPAPGEPGAALRFQRVDDPSDQLMPRNTSLLRESSIFLLSSSVSA